MPVILINPFEVPEGRADEFTALTTPMREFPAGPTLYRVVRSIDERY